MNPTDIPGVESWDAPHDSPNYRPNKWDLRLLNLARHVSEWSRDPSTKTGAVIADNKRVVSLGFNGFPQGVNDMEERYNDRTFKYPMVVHCEVNAVLFAGRPVVGCTLYTWPFMSCADCAGIMIQAGIKRVVSPWEGYENPRWKDSFVISRQMFKEAGVDVAFIKTEALNAASKS